MGKDCADHRKASYKAGPAVMRKTEVLQLLEEYRQLPALLKEARLELKLESEIKSPTYSTMPKASGMISDPTAKLAIKRLGASKRIAYLVLQYEKMVQTTFSMSLGPYLLFECMYDEGLTLEEVAKKTGWTRKHTEDIHDQLIKHIAREY